MGVCVINDTVHRIQSGLVCQIDYLDRAGCNASFLSDCFVILSVLVDAKILVGKIYTEELAAGAVERMPFSISSVSCVLLLIKSKSSMLFPESFASLRNLR